MARRQDPRADATPCTTAAAPSRACAPTTRSTARRSSGCEEHTERLFNSAKILRMKIPFTQEQVMRGAEGRGAREQAGELLPAPADLDRRAEARRQPQGQHHPPDGRRLGLGRLPGRRRHEARHPRQDLQLHPPPRQHHHDAGQGGEQLHQLDPGQHGSDWTTATTRPCCSTPAASCPKARARTSSWSRTAWSTRPTCRPARSTASPATPCCTSARTWAWKLVQKRITRDEVYICRRGLLHRHRRRGHADPRTRPHRARQRLARPDHRENPERVL